MATQIYGTVESRTPPRSEKKVCDAYVLAIVFGVFGAHHFYLHRPGFGFLYLFTLGLLGVGYIVDLFRLPILVKDANQRLENPTQPERKLLSDAYTLWFPFGLLGFHHFYLRRPCWGLVYLFTLGLFGIGWLIDGIRMKHLVDTTNCKIEQLGHSLPKKYTGDAYVLALFPLTGILGGHHYYLNRPQFGCLYTFTFGLLGVGYIFDWFRIPFLVSEANKKIEEGDTGKKRLDDAYILLFPLGFLGLHHFYLRRYGWGMLYLFTFGCLWIGWLIDFFRLPCLVNDYNNTIHERRVLVNGSTYPRTGCVIQTHPYGYGSSGYGPPYGLSDHRPPGYGPPFPGPPAYGPQHQDSLLSIASSNVDQPPSYQESTSTGYSAVTAYPSAPPDGHHGAPPLPYKGVP